MELIFRPGEESYKIAYSLKTSALNAGTAFPGKIMGIFRGNSPHVYRTREKSLSVGRSVGGSGG